MPDSWDLKHKKEKLLTLEMQAKHNHCCPASRSLLEVNGTFWLPASFAAPGFQVVWADGEAGSVCDSSTFPEPPRLLAS